MKKLLINLNSTKSQDEALSRLHEMFVSLCTRIFELGQINSCFSRVGLHHLTYRQMRLEYPEIGSQMVCNGIYLVSRVCKAWDDFLKKNLHLHPSNVVPGITFLPSTPVVYDSHTLSIKGHRISLLAIDGRLHFDFALSAEEQAIIGGSKIRWIQLLKKKKKYYLEFSLVDRHEAVLQDQRQPDFSSVELFTLAKAA